MNEPRRRLSTVQLTVIGHSRGQMSDRTRDRSGRRMSSDSNGMTCVMLSRPLDEPSLHRRTGLGNVKSKTCSGRAGESPRDRRAEQKAFAGEGIRKSTAG